MAHVERSSGAKPPGMEPLFSLDFVHLKESCSSSKGGCKAVLTTDVKHSLPPAPVQWPLAEQFGRAGLRANGMVSFTSAVLSQHNGVIKGRGW